MTLLIACLLIYLGDLYYGWYIAATFLWITKQIIKWWSVFYNACDDAQKGRLGLRGGRTH
jgi:hypothetical protein